MTTTTAVTTETNSDLKKGGKDKEILVFQDVGEFRHCTGDVYNGGFEIKKKEHVAKMFGFGVYVTNEGDRYTGRWENDLLKEASICYTTYAKYEGPLKDWCYNSTGVYKYPDETVLEAEFHDNCPTGQLVIKDPNKHIWLAKAETGFAWFNPANHYYDILEGNPKKTKSSHSRLKLPTSSPKDKDSRKSRVKA